MNEVELLKMARSLSLEKLRYLRDAFFIYRIALNDKCFYPFLVEKPWKNWIKLIAVQIIVVEVQLGYEIFVEHKLSLDPIGHTCTDIYFTNKQGWVDYFVEEWHNYWLIFEALFEKFDLRMALKLNVFGFFVFFCELKKRHLVLHLMLKNLGAVEVVLVAQTLFRSFVMINHFLNLVA